MVGSVLWFVWIPEPQSLFDESSLDNHLSSVSATESQVDIGTMITRTPAIKGGSPHIAGTGVLVRTIARWYKLGLSPEEIAAEYPQLALSQVYAALAYYHANREEMEAHMAAEEADSNQIEREYLQRTKGRK